MENKLKNLKSNLLVLFFPKFCLGCGEEGRFVCSQCLKQIKNSELCCPFCGKVNFKGGFCKSHQKSFSFSKLLFVNSFEGLAKEIIHALKYEGLIDIAQILGVKMAQILLANITKKEKQEIVLIPVPLFFLKRFKRGFNQSELLAKVINQKTNIPLRKVVFRVKNTKSQTQLDVQKRKQNIASSFILAPSLKKKDYQNKILIIVDDVYTSGSTLNEVAKILKQLRPKAIWGLTFCKD